MWHVFSRSLPTARYVHESPSPSVSGRESVGWSLITVLQIKRTGDGGCSDDPGPQRLIIYEGLGKLGGRSIPGSNGCQIQEEGFDLNQRQFMVTITKRNMERWISVVIFAWTLVKIIC